MFACQRDSYLTQFETKVKSCTSTDFTVLVDGKKEKKNGYEVLLDDTILFPEGGGQPDDRGTINGIDVYKVVRKAGDAIHYTLSELSPKQDVKLVVDWTRRFDHMTQHTGQHLITALATSMFGHNTTSWNLGSRTSFIELDVGSMTNDEISKLETACNQKIRDCVKVHTHIHTDKDHPSVIKARSRGLPADHVGPVRLIEIEGVDENLCCGTHMCNLSQLQCIKLLSVEKGKKKNTCNLNFVVGARVLQYLSRLHEVERAMTVILKGPLEQHTELAEKAVKGYKMAEKVAFNVLKDLAVLEVQNYKLKDHDDNIFIYHRKEADDNILSMIANEMDQNVICFLTCGDDKGTGMFLLSGDDELLNELGPRIASQMEGKGFINRGRFKGKCNKLTQRVKAEKLLREYIKGKAKQAESQTLDVQKCDE